MFLEGKDRRWVGDVKAKAGFLFRCFSWKRPMGYVGRGT